MTSLRSNVLVETSPELPLVWCSVSHRTGAAADPFGKEGLGLLACRLMRRTGGGLSTEALDERIDSLGGALSVDVGQSTASFHGTVISRSLDAFSSTLRDVVANPSLSEPELVRLKRETEAEIIESRDNDRAMVRRWFRRRLYDAHPYGRPVAGTITSIRTISAEELRNHIDRTMTKDGLVFAFAGDIHREQAEAVAERILSALPDTVRPADDVPEPTVASGRRLLIIDKPERTQTQILIGGLGTHPHDDDHLALHVGNTIFGGTFTARLSHEIRSKRGWSYGAYSSLPYDRRRRELSLWTFPKAEDAPACISLQLEMLAKWRDSGVTKRELDWAKRYLIRSHAFSIDTATKRVQQALDETLYDLPDGYHRDYVKRIRDTTLDEVNAAIEKRVSVDDVLIAVLGTNADIGEAIRDAVQPVVSAEVVRYDAE